MAVIRVTGSDGNEYDVNVAVGVAVSPVAPVVPVPPPVPVPPVSTVGKIASFSPTSGTVAMTIDGKATKNINANATANNGWSINQIDDYTMKYEVRAGDRAKAANGWSDSVGSERSETEMMPRYQVGQVVTIEYGFILHPGSTNTSQWMLCGQFHFDKGSGSPPVGVAFFGEKMCIILRGPDNRENRVWTDPNPIERGRKYAMKLEINIKGGNFPGTCKVWRDGVMIVNYSGPLGSGVAGDTHYWKQGVYRAAASLTMAATYSNHHVTVS